MVGYKETQITSSDVTLKVRDHTGMGTDAGIFELVLQGTMVGGYVTMDIKWGRRSVHRQDWSGQAWDKSRGMPGDPLTNAGYISLVVVPGMIFPTKVSSYPYTFSTPAFLYKYVLVETEVRCYEDVLLIGFAHEYSHVLDYFSSIRSGRRQTVAERFSVRKAIAIGMFSQVEGEGHLDKVEDLGLRDDRQRYLSFNAYAGLNRYMPIGNDTTEQAISPSKEGGVKMAKVKGTQKGTVVKKVEAPVEKAPSALEIAKERLAKGKFEYVEKVELGAKGKSFTGRRLYHGYKIRDTKTGEEFVIGRGELKEYAHLELPKQPRGKAAAEGEEDLDLDLDL